MKIKTRKTKTGTTISIRAESEQDKDTLTKAILTGRLIRELNKIPNLSAEVEIKRPAK